MILYHASNVRIEKPDVFHSRDFLDFGKGFYLTTLKEQAEKYSERFKRRGQEAWLNTYEFEFNPSEWKYIHFEEYNEEWLEFVSKCRWGEDDSFHDIVSGGIANDKVIRTLDRYFEGELSMENTLGLLKYEKPNNQICIRSQRMIEECLTFLDSIKL